ncbi:thiolase family protein [Pseudonocardia asaccharolytica]|uniref:propanoyl-CoA C-acyltransferase n=1 Tax=Pseudonocardia asaccharolytica DSM 44247 = NBRC 16224 TaxID=1123024 RepID=A0A511D6R5_9PSEU|nr:thiolase family protein [Pseudonocardia asaccharolytica]GEL20462.1 thiolase [Pseudonocardia asaccharolytica DSM 44247 = NBRC 16224]
MRDVYVAGIGMTRFAKQPDRSIKDLLAEAVTSTLKDAGRGTADVQAAYVGNAAAGTITGQEMVLGQVGLRPLGIGGIPVINTENACASASTAFHLAWQAVATGAHDIVLAVAAEKLTHPDKARSFAAIGGSVDVETVPPDLPAGRSFLMDLYGAAALDYMAESGTTAEDLARVVIKNQHNGALNPVAQYGGELTIEEVLNARLIVEPFTLQMCSPITDGAAAALLVSPEYAASPQIRVLASVVRSAPVDGATKVIKLASQAAYEVAGLGPDDIDCIEVHDAAASAELMAYEQLGLTELGGAKEMIRTGQTDLGGRIPVNTSGGLLSRGHPIGATGLAQIAEAVLQLRGTADGRQVENARIAMAQNAGGWHGNDNVASVIHLFERS